MASDDGPGDRRATGSDADRARAQVATAARELGLDTGWVSATFADRYLDGDQLGIGGMGEVRSARDRRVGRDVAIKRLRAPQPSPDQIARFLREARVQGRLEHPAVVPIHDVGLDDDGRPYLVMKRLDGVTLADLLVGRASPAVVERWPRRALLGAFAQVCLAIDFAHSRGVIHRDLKPANILVGAFGEVYVLDWGVARLADDAAGEVGASGGSDPGPVRGPVGAGDATMPATADATGSSGPLPTVMRRPPTTGSGDVDLPTSSDTAWGTVMGTPAYMAPEQRSGQVAVDARADVYSLGCVLFEILTGRSFASFASLPATETALDVDADDTAARSALPRIATSPSVRFPDADIPPELDIACALACAAEADQRLPTARALHDAVQRYLDGDRDLALRRALAAGHTDAARRLLDDGDGDHDRRAAAMREAGAALALDPSSTEAAAITSRLLLEPPATPPPAVTSALETDRLTALRSQGKAGLLAYLAYLAAVPFVFVVGVKTLLFPLALTAVLLVQIAVSVVGLRRDRIDDRLAFVFLAGDIALLVLVGRVCGPLFIVPAQVTGMTIVYMRTARTRYPALIPVALLAAVVVPMILELVGVWPASYQFRDGTLIVRSSVIDLAAGWTLPTMLVILAVNVATIALIAGTVQREHADTARRLRTQAWHLGQLVGPTSAAGPARPRPAAASGADPADRRPIADPIAAQAAGQPAGGGSASNRSSSPRRSRSRRSE